uniref:Uncharacterized protein n=1 Tax=Anguilla anguilla TaxID=7936 RepID=A0A0E9XI43_ANGAN
MNAFMRQSLVRYFQDSVFVCAV